MKIKDLNDLFLAELSDIRSAERQIVAALPNMIRKATSTEVTAALEDHLRVTERQVERLDQVFASINEKPKRVKCKGMEGLLEEGKDMIEDATEPAVRDAIIVAAAQKVEHYEIAGYGSAATYAEMLEEKDVAKKLKQNLGEEQRTDEKLTKLAEGRINKAAMSKH